MLGCAAWGETSLNTFWSTSLPATSTKWFDLSIQAFPHSKKCRWLISATSRIWKKSLEHRESNQGLLGEKRKHYLCAMPPLNKHQHLIRIRFAQNYQPEKVFAQGLSKKITGSYPGRIFISVQILDDHLHRDAWNCLSIKTFSTMTEFGNVITETNFKYTCSRFIIHE